MPACLRHEPRAWDTGLPRPNRGQKAAQTSTLESTSTKLLAIAEMACDATGHMTLFMAFSGDRAGIR